MCNAWNHSADCACGFGPPYSKGKITAGERRKWYESLPTDYGSFERWLMRLRLEPGDVEEGRNLYRRSLSDSGYTADYKGHAAIRLSARSKIIEWVRRVISGYTYETLTTHEAKIDVPLFTLRSPRVKGSQVVYRDRKGIGQAKGWSITVFGAGFGASREMRVEYGMEFYCTSGSCKQVYVPQLPVRIVVNKVYKGRAILGELTTVEVCSLERERYFGKGIRSCPKQQSLDEQSPDDRVENFSLTKGMPGETTTITRKWTSGESREIPLEIGVGALKANIRASIRAEEEIELTYGLPEGHDYEVRYLAKQHGIVWAVK